MTKTGKWRRGVGRKTRPYTRGSFFRPVRPLACVSRFWTPRPISLLDIWGSCEARLALAAPCIDILARRTAVKKEMRGKPRSSRPTGELPTAVGEAQSRRGDFPTSGLFFKPDPSLVPPTNPGTAPGRYSFLVCLFCTKTAPARSETLSFSFSFASYMC